MKKQPKNAASTDRLDNLKLDKLDALFRLPLAEFIDARNKLIARLKKGGHGDDAVLVKALAKPSVSVWAVNQLYWNHREAFDRLISSGERFHKAQTSGKIADMRGALDGRRDALTNLSNLATSLLQDAGHNPSLDTIRRVTSTLEALSVYATRSDAPRPGRLTADVDPPGFESLGSFVPTAGLTKAPPRLKVAQKPSSAATKPQRKPFPDNNARQTEEKRKSKIAAAKVSLQDAKKSLAKTRARAERLEAAQKIADAEAKQAERRKRDAEKNLDLAKSSFEYAAERARTVAAEVEEVSNAIDEAERAVEEASRELKSFAAET